MSRHDTSNIGSLPRRSPTSAEMRGIEAAMRSDDTALAISLASEAARTGADHALVLVLAVHGSLGRGAADEALAYALRARALGPRDPQILNAYALALVNCDRAREALAVYDAALRLAPDRSSLHYNKGCAFEALSDKLRARLSFERAVALQPTNTQALARLANIAAARSDVGEARAQGERALRLQPGEPVATLALASADVEEKKFDAALARLGPLMAAAPGIDRSIAEGLAGDALDGLGRHDDAFRAYAVSNATRRAIFHAAPGSESARTLVARLSGYFRDAKAWPREQADEAAQSCTHVFLVGFPRSGTTLLEQVLAAHPDVETMEERDCLADAQREFLGGTDDLDRLAALSGGALEPWRKAYWARVAEWGVEPSRSVFVDKLPLNTIYLFLIAKLFPRAKILFALRDPVDVVWNCFRRRFGMSAQMYEFLTLEGAARHYDAVMTLAELYRDKLALDLHELRYEAMVNDFEGETRRLCAFLNLEWTEALADFAARTRTRAVNTPSAAQVARGLFTNAVGQWTSYREQLAPILPILAPWRARFGYV